MKNSLTNIIISHRSFLFMLYAVALLLRGLLFHAYIQHEQRYRHPDSEDYHICAMAMASGNGMCRIDSGSPIFFRVPGYSWILQFFYRFKKNIFPFEKYEKDHIKALWIQIILTSCIPLIVWAIILLLTSHTGFASGIAWIIALHPGFILYSTVMLSDIVRTFLFFIFLLFWYNAWPKQPPNHFFLSPAKSLACAAITLGLYTWCHHSGIYVMIISCILLLWSQISWKQYCKYAIVFFSLFAMVIGGWYIRNYRWSGRFFLSTLPGTHFLSFCAPKLLKNKNDFPYIDCCRAVHAFAEHLADQERTYMKKTKSPYVLPPRYFCAHIAWLCIKKEPLAALYNWFIQILKTMGDLFATVFAVTTHKNQHIEPIQEFLFEKNYTTICDHKTPFFIRSLGWFELIALFVIWFGFFMSMVFHAIKPLWHTYVLKKRAHAWNKQTWLWLTTGPFIGLFMAMTGASGYARLRLPIEPFIILIALLWYQNLYQQNNG